MARAVNNRESFCCWNLHIQSNFLMTSQFYVTFRCDQSPYEQNVCTMEQKIFSCILTVLFCFWALFSFPEVEAQIPFPIKLHVHSSNANSCFVFHKSRSGNVILFLWQPLRENEKTGFHPVNSLHVKAQPGCSAGLQLRNKEGGPCFWLG